jgi:hypothetical protein
MKECINSVAYYKGLSRNEWQSKYLSQKQQIVMRACISLLEEHLETLNALRYFACKDMGLYFFPVERK